MTRPEPVGLLVAAARRRIKQAVGRRLAARRLTPPQFWLLVAIQQKRAPSVSELAERLRGDQPTVSRIVATLVRRGLVRVDDDPEDGRRGRLVATAAGQSLQRALAPLAKEVRAAIVRGMDDAEQEALRVGLRKVIENMDLFERGASKPARAKRGSGSSRG
jgi:DNA-binding MarR family transcriptional regulator